MAINELNKNTRLSSSEFKPLILDDEEDKIQNVDKVKNQDFGPQYIDADKPKFVQPEQRSYFVAGNVANNEIHTTAQRPNEIEYEADVVDDEKKKDNYFGLSKLKTNKVDIVKNALKYVVQAPNLIQNAANGIGVLTGKSGEDVFKEGVRGFVGSTVDFGSSMARFFGQNYMYFKAYKDEQIDKITNLGNVVAGGEDLSAEIKQKYTDFYNRIDRQTQEFKDKTERFLQYTGIGKTDKDGFIYDLVGGASSLMYAIGLSVITKSPAAVAEVFGAYQYQSLYEEAIENGFSPIKARSIGIIGGAAEGVLEMVGLHVLIETLAARKSFTKLIKAAATEFIQEASQQGAEEILSTATGMRVESLKEALFNVGYAGLIGALIGGGAAGISNTRFVQKMISDSATKELISKGVNSEYAKQMVDKMLDFSVSPQVANELTDMIKDEQSPVTYKNADPRETYKETGEAIKKALDPQQKRGVELEFIDEKKKFVDTVAKALINSGNFTQEEAYRQAETQANLADGLARNAFEQDNIRPSDYYKRFKIDVASGNIETDERNVDEDNPFVDVSFDPVDFDDQARAEYEAAMDSEQDYIDSVQKENKTTLKKEARILGEMGIDAIRRPTKDGYGKERWSEYNDLSPRIKNYFFTDTETAMTWDEAEDILAKSGNSVKDLFEYLASVDNRAVSLNQPGVFNRVLQKEKEAIKQQAIADGTFLKAPNGKDSNLPEQLWLTVRTKAFKNWFGDWENDPQNASKVVDENGEPLVVYHGTKTDFSIFEGQKIKNTSEGAGFYFTPNKNIAQGFGNIKATFLNIRNPQYAYGNIDLVSDTYEEDYEKENKEAIDKGLQEVKKKLEKKGYKFYKQVQKDLLDVIGTQTQEVLDGLLYLRNFVENENFDEEKIYNDIREAEKEVFKVDGYTTNRYGGDQKVYVAFTSNQIKSINNRGSFDRNNPDIYYQPAYHGTPHRFDEFSTDKIGTGEGAQAHGWGLYFAKERAVSEDYRKNLTNNDGTIYVDGKEIEDKNFGEDFYARRNTIKGKTLKEKLLNYKDKLIERIDWNNKNIEYLTKQIPLYEKLVKELRKNKTADKTEIEDILEKNSDGIKTDVIAAWQDLLDRIEDPYEQMNTEEGYDNELNSENVASYFEGEIFDKQSQIKQSEKDINNFEKKLKTIESIDLDNAELKGYGQVFQVDIPEDNVLLDEDKRFHEQPKKVQESLNKIFKEIYKMDKNEFVEYIDKKYINHEKHDAIVKELKKVIDGKKDNSSSVLAILDNDDLKKILFLDNVGSYIYREIEDRLGSDKEASLLLNKYGIKGIKYNGGWDGRAYVVFDDKAVKILEKFYQGEKNTYNDINDFVKDTYSDLTEREYGPKKSKNLDKLKSVEIKNITEFKTVKELKKFLNDILEGLSELKVEETGQKISISKSRVKRSLKNARNNINNQVYNEIEDLVRNSKYLGFKKADLRHTKVKGQDLFLAKMKIGDKEYLVEFRADVPFAENKLYYAGHKVGASVSDTVITPLLRQKPTNNIVQNQQNVNSDNPRGSTTVFDRQYFINLFANADKSTLMHEMAHAWLSEINYFASAKNATNKVLDIKKQLDNWLGVPDNNGRYSVEQQEKFAQNFEIYLKEGKAPTAKLKTVFARFKTWLSEIYDRIKDELPKLNDDVRELFDSILSRSYDVPDSNIYAGKEKAIKEVIKNIQEGRASEVDGITIDDVYNLLNVAYTRKPSKPSKNLKQLLNDKNIYDFNELNKAGADTVLQILKGGGYVKDDATAEQAVELARQTLDGNPVYRLADQWRVAGDIDFARNLRVLEKVIEFSQIDSTIEKILELQEEGYRNVEPGDVEQVKDEYKRLMSADVKEAKKIVEGIINRLHKKRFIDMRAKKQMIVDLNFSSTVEEIKESVLNVIEDLQDEIKLVKEQLRNPRKPVVRKDKTIPPGKNATEEEKNTYKKYMRKQINRLLKQALPRKQNQQKFSKFDVETQRFFTDLEKYNKMTIEAAQEELYKRATSIIDDEGVGLDNFEKMKNMFLSYKANKINQNSVEFYKQLYDNLQEINVFGRNAKEIEETLKKEQIQKDINNLVVNIEDNKSKNSLATGVKKQYIKWLGNWWSTINAIAGKKQADKDSLERVEINIFNKNYATTEDLKTKCSAALGLKNATDLDMTVNRYLNEEYTYEELDARSGTSNAVKLNKMQLICCYIWMKNDNLKERIVRAYGNIQIMDMMDKLTIQDKKFGDELQQAVASLYDDVNKVYIKMYGLDMPQADNYFPSSVERIQGNMDLLKDNIGQVSSPGFIKARVQSNLPLMNFGNPVKIALDHIAKVNHFIYMQEKLADLNKVYKTTVVKRHITNAYGDRVYKYILQVLDNAKFTTVARTIDGISDIGDYLVNNYVLTKIAVKPSIMIKQLLSCINYAEDMSSVQWFEGFLKGVTTPKKVIDFMMKNSKYCQSRFAKGGQTEALLKAMEGSNATFAKVKTFKGILSWMTRVGDIGAIIFGGYPYVMNQMSKGVSLQAAIENFEKSTIRSQQASLPSTLSNFQYRGMDSWLYRAMFAFANTPNQYSRKIGDTMYLYFHGDINKKQLAKNLILYGALNPLLYTSFTSLAILSGLISGNWDDLKDDIIMSLMQTSNVLALPIISQAYNSFVSKVVTGDFVPDKEIPLLDDMVKIMRTATKEDLEFKDWLTIVDEVASLILGVPVKTLYNEFVGSTKDLLDGEYGKFAVKLYGATESRADKIFN